MSEPLFLPLTAEQRAEQARCYAPGAAGTLSAEMVRKAMEEMAVRRVPLPPPGYSFLRQPFGSVPVRQRDPEWTVTAGGYRLVIMNGAMVGLERTW